MTTPANANTPYRAIILAMKDAGVLGDGVIPPAETLAEHMGRLNDLVNTWQTQGLKLCLIQDVAITLVSGTASYTLGPTGTVVMTKPLRVLDSCYYLDTNNVKRPLLPLSWDDYARLSQVTQEGAISSYFVDKQASYMGIKFWLVPDDVAATGTAHMILETQATNVTGLTDTMTFPQEWFLAMRWGLADEICTGQPPAVQARCAAKANQYRQALEAWDVEDTSTTLAVDSRAYGARSFI